MKNFYKTIAMGVLCLSSTVIYAQTQNVGIGTTAPDNSAVLDIQSAEKGLLIPRMTLEQRDAIKSPANGLMVYQTGDLSGFYYFNGDKWSPMTEAKAVATLDANGWALDGNASATGAKAAATSASFIGTPGAVPINFKIGPFYSGLIDPSTRNNLFLGFKSGNAAISGTGNNNTGLGYEAMLSLNGGHHNTAIGRLAMRNTTTGAANIAIGATALQNNTTGNFNFAIGFGALINNTEGQFNTAIGTSALEQVTGALKNNNTAIGAQAGRYKNGKGNIYIGYAAGHNTSAVTANEDDKLYIGNSVTLNPLIKGDFAAKNLRINVGSVVGTPNTATTAGYLAIGDFDAGSPMAIPTGYRLIVENGILTEKIKVALKSSSVGGDWADYVFEPDYKLMSLEDVEKFTLENKHLPNVPSADEMVEGGLDVAKTSKMFMEKIEELTLYMIELNKEVKTLKMENEVLKTQLR